MTVAVCRVCGERVPLRSDFELDAECPECGADEALIVEDAYDPEPLELICCDCRAHLDGGPAGSGPATDDHQGRYTVEDSCPFCSTGDERGELVPLDTFREPRMQPDTPVARAAATKLWREAGAKVPVDVFAIAGANGLTVTVGPFQHAGLLRDRTIVEVPIRDPLSRQRFTVAHELGHATLRHDVPEERLEVEANAFAAELLLPREWLTQAVSAGLGFRAIAERFGASREATLYALAGARLLGKLARN
jgi:rRNA maturation protein Nop10